MFLFVCLYILLRSCIISKISYFFTHSHKGHFQSRRAIIIQSQYSNIIYIMQAKIRAFAGHIRAYTPTIRGCYPPPIVPPCLFLKYAPTVGRENFSRKITISKIDFYFLAKIQNKNTISKNFSGKILK